MATNRNITTNVIINGINNFSGPIGRGVTSSINSLETLGNRARGIASTSFGVGQKFAGATAALGAGLLLPIRQAALFEDKMADVAKVTNTDVGSSAFRSMSNEVKELSVYLGRTATESADLYTTLAQGGVAVDNLKEIARLAGRVGVAFDISNNDAGSAFSRIQNVLDLPTEKVSLIADAINVLSNTRNAKASEILSFLEAGGVGVAKTFNATGEEIAAFGATLRATVVPSAEQAATVMERFGKGIINSPALRKTFNEAGKGAAGFLAVLNKGLKSSDPDEFFGKFGEYGTSIHELARGMNGPKGLLNALNSVSDPMKIAGSVMGEFTNKQSTTMGKLRIEWSRFNATVIDFGENALPMIQQFVSDSSGLLKNLGQWVSANPKLSTSILQVAAGLTAFSAAVSGVSFAIGGVATAVTAWTRVMTFFAAGGTFATAISSVSIWAEGLAYAALTAGAITVGTVAVATGIAAVGIAAYAAFQKFEPFRRVVTQMYETLVAFDNHSWEWLGAIFSGDFAKAGRIRTAIQTEASINTGADMFDYRKGVQSERIKELRAGRGYGTAEAGTLPEPSGLPKGPANWMSAQTGAVNFSPVLNFNGTVTPDGKKMVDESLLQAKYQFETVLKQNQRDQNRRAIK